MWIADSVATSIKSTNDFKPNGSPLGFITAGRMLFWQKAFDKPLLFL